MTDCPLQFVESLADGRHKHHCPRCGKDCVSRYADPAQARRACGVAPVVSPPKEPPPEEPPCTGACVGDKLGELVAGWGLAIPCGECKLLKRDMNAWGPDECERRKPEIVKRLEANSKKLPRRARLKAMARAARAGYFSLGAIVDQAIKMARANRN